MNLEDLIIDDEYCDCSCHGWNAVHSLPCCNGECHICNRFIVNFEKHKETCPEAEDPLIRMVREIEKREEK